jgi:hypothetical protein
VNKPIRKDGTPTPSATRWAYEQNRNFHHRIAAGFLGMAAVDAVIGGIEGTAVAVLTGAVVVWLVASMLPGKKRAGGE